MADRIKGITIELDGETTGLKKALSDVTSQSIDVQKELKDIDRLLKFDPGNVEAVAQKQQLLSKQIEITSKKLNTLKDAEKQVEEQFNKGDIGEKQFRAFQREIQFTEGDLKKLKQTLAKVDDGSNIQKVKKDMDDLSKSTEEAEDKTGELRSGLSQLVVGAAAGVGISKVVDEALEASSLNTQINVSFNVPEESVQSVKNAISTVESYGVDGEAALEGVRRQWALNKDASDESNAEVVEGAATIVAAYGDIDFTELIQETNELSKTLGISDQDAIALTYSLLKMGFPPDQIDIISEYGTQLKMAGYDAQEIQGIMAAGVDTGTWNIDNLLDGLKEGRIKMAEFGVSVDNTTAGLLKGTSISQQQLQNWGKAVAQGGANGTKAMQEVAQALTNVKDDTARNALGVQLFGTMWEDQGSNITKTLLGMNDHLKTTEENEKTLNEATSNLNSDPMVQMKTAVSNLITALTPLLVIIAGVIGKIAEWVANNPTFAATITAIVVTVSILIGILVGIAPLITTIITAAAALEISIGAIAIPVLIVIGVIAALVAAGVALYANWDWIKEKAGEVWEWVKEKFQAFLDWLGGVFTTDWSSSFGVLGEYLNALLANISNIWDSIKSVFNGVIDFVAGVFSGDWGRAWEGVKEIFGGVMEGLGAVIKAPLNGIIGLINMAIDGLNSISVDIPDFIPGIGGSHFGVDIGKIPYLAKGGVVSGPTLAMVGEAGKEAVMPLENNTGWINELATQIAGVLNQNSMGGNTVLYAEIPVSLDGKAIANATTPIVLSNISRTQLNRNKSKGRG